MPDLSIVLPTIRGREASLDRTVGAYNRTLPADVTAQLIVLRDQPTAGAAWNAGASLARAPLLHFTGDDLEPQPGWYEAAVAALAAGWWPAPRILRADGTLEACGSDGEQHRRTEQPDWSPCTVSTIPFLRTADWPGPVLPIHYGSDSHFSLLARQRGGRFAYRAGYAFVHHWHPIGRARMQARAAGDLDQYRAAVAAAAQA